MTGGFLVVSHLNRDNLRRIFSKVAVDKTTCCWIWTASVNTAGYGSGSVSSIPGPIHRLLYAWLVEPLPKGLGRAIPQLDHFACDNRKCVNPSHIKLVTARENVLRGTSQAAIHAARTHCKNGHLKPARKEGEKRRVCKLCQKRDARQLALHR